MLFEDRRHVLQQPTGSIALVKRGNCCSQEGLNLGAAAAPPRLALHLRCHLTSQNGRSKAARVGRNVGHALSSPSFMLPACREGRRLGQRHKRLGQPALSDHWTRPARFAVNAGWIECELRHGLGCKRQLLLLPDTSVRQQTHGRQAWARLPGAEASFWQCQNSGIILFGLDVCGVGLRRSAWRRNVSPTGPPNLNPPPLTTIWPRRPLGTHFLSQLWPMTGAAQARGPKRELIGCVHTEGRVNSRDDRLCSYQLLIQVVSASWQETNRSSGGVRCTHHSMLHGALAWPMGRSHCVLLHACPYRAAVAAGGLGVSPLDAGYPPCGVPSFSRSALCIG